MTWADVKKSNACNGECEWKDQLERVDAMLDAPQYEFAWEVLDSMRDWIAKAKHVTKKQKRAIHNIKHNMTGMVDMFDVYGVDDLPQE